MRHAAMWTLMALPGCAVEAGSQRVVYRSVDGGEPEQYGRGCTLVGRDGERGGGGGGGPDYATESEAENGKIRYAYFIVPEASISDPSFALTPDTGELAADFETTIEELLEGEETRLLFDTYDGVHFEAIHWGTEDCDGGLDDMPPPS